MNALELAELLDNHLGWPTDASVELRRLHAINAELVEALEEVMAYCKEHGNDWMCMAHARASIEKAKQ